MTLATVVDGACVALEALSARAAAAAKPTRPQTPLQHLLALPGQGYVACWDGLESFDTGGFIRAYWSLLVFVVITWTISATSCVCRFQTPRRWLWRLFVFMKTPSRIPTIAIQCALSGLVLAHDASVRRFPDNCYIVGSAQGFLGFALISVGLAHPRVKIVRVRKVLPALEVVAGMLLATVSFFAAGDLAVADVAVEAVRQNPGAATTSSILFLGCNYFSDATLRTRGGNVAASLELAARLVLQVGLTMATLLGVHGVGGFLGLPLLFLLSQVVGSMFVFIVKIVVVTPLNVFREYVRPTLIRGVLSVLRCLHNYLLQLLVLAETRLAKPVWRLMLSVWARFYWGTRRCVSSVGARLRRHIGPAVLHGAMRLRRLSAETWRVIRHAWTHRVGPVLLHAVNVSARQVECLARRAKAEALAMAREVETLVHKAALCCQTCWQAAVVIPEFLGRTINRVVAQLRRFANFCLRWLRSLLETFHQWILLPVGRQLEPLAILARLYFWVAEELCTLALRKSGAFIAHLLRRIQRHAHSVGKRLWIWIVQSVSGFWAVLRPMLALCSRLVSPIGCFGFAGAFAYNLWLHMVGGGADGSGNGDFGSIGFFSVASVLAYVLAIHSSHSVGLLLFGRFLRRWGGCLSAVGARLEVHGSWLFLHLDLYMLSVLWKICTTCLQAILHTSQSALRFANAFARVLQVLAGCMEAILDRLVQSVWSVVKFVWRKALWYTVAGVGRFVLRLVMAIWTNPTASFSLSVLLVAYAYQIHLGVAPAPDWHGWYMLLRLISDGIVSIANGLLGRVWLVLSAVLGWSARVVLFVVDAFPPARLVQGGIMSQTQLALESLAHPLELFAKPYFAKFATLVSLACSRLAMVTAWSIGLTASETLELAARVGRTSQRMIIIPVVSGFLSSRLGNSIMPVTWVYALGSILFLRAELNGWRSTSNEVQRMRAAAAGNKLGALNVDYEMTRVDTVETEDACCICLEPLADESRRAIVSLRCGHILHGSCIQEWLQRSNRCPLCREVLGSRRGQALQGVF
eukprot:TRINITY_DN13520_c0_g1_i1.p1 TRINITY_DN13520_c0_g1~~TRINITY_DN13520_c0_g1_i1.p1  ORF type:complete len:1031 (+),score=116.26 TRINITY_DN13520_c0_g1_i1:42-3134(+)